MGKLSHQMQPNPLFDLELHFQSKQENMIGQDHRYVKP